MTEIATCLPIIEKTIELVNPKLIVSLGTFAGQVFTGRSESLNKIRGKFYSYESVTEAVAQYSIDVRPLYHPLDLMVTPALKAEAWSDLLAVQHKMKES